MCIGSLINVNVNTWRESIRERIPRAKNQVLNWVGRQKNKEFDYALEIIT